MIGRQKLQNALSSQTLMAVSANDMLSIAKRRALSSGVSVCCAEMVRKMRFQVRPECSAQYRDAFVCAAVRVVLVSEPTDLTSLNSAA